MVGQFIQVMTGLEFMQVLTGLVMVDEDDCVIVEV